MKTEKEVGRELVRLRGKRKAKDVASELRISKAALSMYESGERWPRDDVKVKLADYYHVTVGALFYGERAEGKEEGDAHKTAQKKAPGGKAGGGKGGIDRTRKGAAGAY